MQSSFISSKLLFIFVSPEVNKHQTFNHAKDVTRHNSSKKDDDGGHLGRRNHMGKEVE